MKILGKFLKGIILLLLIVIIGLYFSPYDFLLKGVSCTYLRGTGTANIDDHEYFDTRAIETSDVQTWEQDSLYNKVPISTDFDELMKSSKSAAYMVIKNGKIVSENYYNGYDDSSKTNSFSMAKSVITMLVSIAIKEGTIPSWDTPLYEYFPIYNTPLGKKVTLADLSRMSSGLDWTESYTGPLGITAQAYYDDELDTLMLSRKIINEPGQSFEYFSGNTQLLSMVLRKATGKNVSEYTSQKLWKPLGMNDNGLWHLDEEDGVEKAYCCINTNARNYAKLGQLMLQNGKWKDTQIIDSAQVALLTKPVFEGGQEYGYSFWMDWTYSSPMYLFRGHLGQYIIVLPNENMVVVRLGQQVDMTQDASNLLPNFIYKLVDEAVILANKID